MVQLVGGGPLKQKVAISIPRQGTCLDCGSVPNCRCVQEATDGYFSLTSIFLSLPLSLESIKEKEKKEGRKCRKEEGKNKKGRKHF